MISFIWSKENDLTVMGIDETDDIYTVEIASSAADCLATAKNFNGSIT